MAELKATARVMCRPLSYESKDIAVPKEVLVDYATGNVYVCKDDGTFTDIGTTVKEIIKQDTTITENIVIEIEGNIYTLETIIAEQAKTIDELQNALGYYTDENGDVKFDLLDKIATVDPDTGEIEFVIKTEDIVESDDKQFVSAAEKEDWNKATYPEIIKATIKGGESYWTGDAAPYTQQVTVEGIKESDVPVVDISLGDIYETVQKQLDSYAYIYKILTYDGYIVVYASEPTVDDLTVQMKVDR